MVNSGTSTAGSIPRAANEVFTDARAIGAGRTARCQQIQQLREAIEDGRYFVSASDVTGALLRWARQAN